MKYRTLTKRTSLRNIYASLIALALAFTTIPPTTTHAADSRFSTPKALAAGLASVGAGSLMAGLTIMLPAQQADAAENSKIEDLRVFSSLYAALGVGMIAAAPFVVPSDNSDDLSMGTNFWYGFAVSAAGSALIGSGLSLATPALLADASENSDIEDLRAMGWGLVGVGMLASGVGAYLIGQPGEATLTVQIGPNYSGLAYQF